jgi:hypothetical protein
MYLDIPDCLVFDKRLARNMLFERSRGSAGSTSIIVQNQEHKELPDPTI